MGWKFFLLVGNSFQLDSQMSLMNSYVLETHYWMVWKWNTELLDDLVGEEIFMN